MHTSATLLGDDWLVAYGAPYRPPVRLETENTPVKMSLRPYRKAFFDVNLVANATYYGDTTNVVFCLGWIVCFSSLMQSAGDFLCSMAWQFGQTGRRSRMGSTTNSIGLRASGAA